MDSKTTTPATSPLAAMFQNATIDKAEGNEFNSARDIFKLAVNNTFNFTKEGENLVFESSDVMEVIQNVVQSFLAEVRNNDQSRSTAGEKTAKDSSDSVLPQTVTTAQTAPYLSTLEDLVDVMDLVPPEPSSFPVTSIADMYTRSMLKCLRGYPLYNPKPFSELSKEYLHSGVNVGDVGFVRGSGTFDFLFNICPPQNGSINPPNLPDGFSLETPEHSATTVLEPFPQNTSLFRSPITKSRSGEYTCEGPEGAILELPKGAIQDDLMNTRPFEKLAAHHGVQWYEYTMNRGRGISNGSLYLITSVTKCTRWGIAVFDRPCASGQGLRFDKRTSLPFVGKSNSKYRWKGSGIFPTNVSNPDKGDPTNQCVFVRGYKIMIRQDIFDKLGNDPLPGANSAISPSSPQAGSSTMSRQPATRIRGGGGPDPAKRLSLTGAGLFSQTTMTKSDEEVVLHSNFNSSLVHPLDLINAALLSQNPGAKIALTHDDVWCDLLRDNFPKLNYATLTNIARLYTNTLKYDCVSLEKISDSSNVLEESGHPFRGTGTPALQGSLTPSYDDYAAITALTLPRELLERIILLLDTKYMLKCRLVNREFNAIIQSSTLLQYYLSCKAAGVVDNPQSPLSYTERHEALKKREDAWRKLTPAFETTIKVIDQPSAFYELTAGNYFLTDKNRKDLYYCRFPSSLQDDPQWFAISGHGPGQSWSGFIVDMGLAVYEHDLVVNVISTDVGNEAGMQRHSLDLVILKFSTREYHPLARQPVIHVQKSPSARPATISVKIVGDNLALVVHDEDGSKLFIFDWKTGHKRLQHKATEDAYACSVLVFVSPELLLVPNLILPCFEVWHLFSSHPHPMSPVQILSLKIPAVSRNYSITNMESHGELSPFLHSIPYFPPRPFFPSSENSIITVNLLLESESGLRSAYKLIMHRPALLDMIKERTSPSLLEQQKSLALLTNEVTVHESADPDDGSIRVGALSELVYSPWHSRFSPQNRDSLTLATSPSHVSTDSSSSSISSESASSTSRYNIPQVQWADWGPPISRWFQLGGTHTWWNHQSTGQRCVFLEPNLHDKKKCKVGVADFNLHNVRRSAEMMAQLREGNHSSGIGNSEEGRNEENEEELELLDHEAVFSEDVYMGLKCVVHHAPGEYDFDVVLMDEERLLGLKLNGENREESIKVLYFG